MWQQLLLMATLLLAPCPVNSIKELPGVQNYEVVYPKRLHPRHKREVKDPGQQENFETELKYEMTVNGKIAVLYLKKNKNLLAPGYTETYYNSSGKAVTTSPQIMDNCYYQGHIVNEKVSDASISTCRGLRGYFSQGDQKYFIEPLSLTNQDEQEHALFKHDPEEQKTKSSCGMNDTIWAPGIHLKALSSTSLATSKDQKFWEKKKYVEYYLVLDHGEFKRHNQDQEEIRKTVFEMVNYINMLYKKLNTYVALIGMEIWNDKDKIDISSNAKLTLENFSKWRTGVLLKRKHHDVAQLLTTVAFSGTTVGLAYISTMCSPDFSAGIIKDHSNNALQVAGTMAHEMGHNFGMFHDNYDCKCPSIECVMDGSLSINIPTDFSSCSRASFEKFFEDKLSNCLFNVPLPTDIISTPICGNQLVEMGEDCDCGTPEECTNICCDAKTCKMKENVQCALGECCEKCQLKKAGEVCRPAKDECDLPEMCDGKSTLCPSDRYQINGFPCQNGKGYCRMGTCPTLEKQCTDLWGPGAQVADKSCFRRNEDGSTYGYCRKVNNTHIPCKAKDATCGKLFCNGGSDYLPWKGRIVTILTCRLFDPEDSSEEIGMVINGTKCGDKKVCINAECVDMERTYKSANCSSKCKGHAVCDHELKCQCKEGWAPPDCSDSSTIFNFSIVVGVLLPVAVIFVMLAIVIRCRSSREKQKLVQRPLSTTDAGLHNQKRKPQMAKTVQPQELPTNPSFPPPLISTSVSSSFLRSRGKIKLDSEGGEIKLDNWSDHNFVLSRTSQLPAVVSMSLVLLSILCLIIQTQAITIRQTLESELYEVVHPKKLHILHKREIQNNQNEKHGKEERYEPELQYQMMLNGEEVILSLQKAEHLLGPDYTETYYSPGGEEITTRPQNMEHCYYKGHILNEKDSVASISTCDGLRGYFTHHNQRYMIKPLKSTGREEHAILRYNQEELNPANHTCGVRNVGRKQDLIRTSRSLRSPEIEEFLQGEKYIDLLLVLDNAFYKMYNENITVIRSFVFDVINLLNVIYNTIDIQVSLVGMEIWSNSDKIKVVPSTAVTFKNFLNWHYSNLGKMKTHDHAQLLSGVGFKTRMAGLATSNSLCSPSSVAVIEGKRKNSVSLVGVMSHELGHVLGMPDVPHNTKCPSGSCVMNKYLSSKFPKDFSTVSRSHFKKYMLSQKPRCLLQALVPKNMTKPVCGNQLLEVGEDCDCGSPEECTNPCCEAMTCMLKHEVDCGKETEQ